VTYAKFGKDLFNISKVIGRKQSGPGFLAYPVLSDDFMIFTIYFASSTSVSIV